MPSTYTLNNGIELIGTGEQSGTWGDTTNTNLELLDTALDGQVTVTLSSTGSGGSPNTLPISDGSSSNGRNRLVVFNDGSDIGGTVYVQLTPNDAEKIIYVRNSLSGSRSILLFQGTYNASNDYEIPAGTTAIVFFNGGGTGAVAANVFNNAYFDGLRLGSVSVDKILDEDNMASNDAAALATQQSIKAYVDTQVGANNELSEVLANGNTSGGTAIQMTTTDELQFRDTALKISSSADGQLDIDADTEIEIVAPTVDIDASTAMTIDTAAFTVTGAVDFNTSLNVDGTVTADGLTVEGGASIQNDAASLTVSNAAVDRYQRFRRNASNSLILDKYNGSTTSNTAKFDENGDITFYDTSGNASFVYDESAGSTFNEQGADRDFRVESDSNSHALFVDAGLNVVTVGNSSPENWYSGYQAFQVGLVGAIASNETGSDTDVLQITSNAYLQDVSTLWKFMEDSVGATRLQMQGQDIQFHMSDAAGAANSTVTWHSRMRIETGGTTFNEGGSDYDFRVESQNFNDMLFVDASTNAVGIGAGTTLPTTTTTWRHLFVGGNLAFMSNTTGNEDVYMFSNMYYNNAFTVRNDGKVAYLRMDDGILYFASSNATQTAGDTASYNNYLTIAPSNETIFNNDGLDQDFRVESDTNTHALFVDASANKVAIGSTQTNGLLTVIGSGSGTYNTLTLSSNAAGNTVKNGGITYLNYAGNSASVYQSYTSSTASALYFGSADTSHRGPTAVYFMAADGLDTTASHRKVLAYTKSIFVVNDDSNDIDFRVESDADANCLFVNGASNHIGMGQGTSPDSKLHIGQSSSGAIAIDSDINTSSTVPTPTAARRIGEIHAGANAGSGSDGGLLRLSAGGESSVNQKATIDLSGYNTTDNGPTMRFWTGASTSMHINYAGDVSIGGSGGKGKFYVNGWGNSIFYGGGGTALEATAVFRGDGATASQQDFSRVAIIPSSSYGTSELYMSVRGFQAYGEYGAGIRNVWGGSDARNNELHFFTSNSGSQNGYRGKFDSFGSFLVGTTSVTTTGVGGVTLKPGYSLGRTIIQCGSTGTSAGTELIHFYNNNGLQGSIQTNSSGTVYATTSDYRLKENVVEITNATDRLKQLKPSRFNFINDPDMTVDGFLAHEVQAVVPEAVSGTKDAMRDEEYEITPAVFDENGEMISEAVMGTRQVPEYQGIDQGKLVPLLVKTIQELEARITALENA